MITEKPSIPPAFQQALERQEMWGERLVNRIRIGFCLLSLGMFISVWSVNTPIANYIFLGQVVGWLLFSLAFELYLSRLRDRYVGWLKYFSVTIDLVALGVPALAMALNHSGIIEWFQSPQPLVLVLWTLLAGLRFSAGACFYAAGLSTVVNGTVLAFTVAGRLLPLSPQSAYGRPAINLGEEVVRIVFMVIPVLVAALMVRTWRNLILRAEEEREQREEAAEQRDTLGRYVAPEVIELAVHSVPSPGLGGVRRNATILFADVRDFTRMSESREPEEVVAMLNTLLEDLVSIVFRYRGTLDKFLGDGLLAVFGAPFDVSNPPLQATLAAAQMVRAMPRLNQRLSKQGWPKIAIGVGIATGPVVSGNIGTSDRLEFTCVGDAVNFASRLQGLSREVEHNVILSQRTAEELNGRLPLVELGPRRIKGKSSTVEPRALDLTRLTAEEIDRLTDELDAKQ